MAVGVVILRDAAKWPLLRMTLSSDCCLLHRCADRRAAGRAMQEGDAGERAEPRAHSGEDHVYPVFCVADDGNDDSRYQTLLHVAAGTRRRATTAEVNIT